MTTEEGRWLEGLDERTERECREAANAPEPVTDLTYAEQKALADAVDLAEHIDIYDPVFAATDRIVAARVADAEARVRAEVADVVEERGYAVQEQRDRAEAAEAERDALRRQVEAVRALANEWERERYPGTGDPGWNQGYDTRRGTDAEALRATLDAPVPADIERLIEASSLGTPEAKAARESVPREVGSAIRIAAKHMGRADRAESDAAALAAAVEALADDLEQDIADRREDTPPDDGSWPISRAEWVGHIAGLGDALTQLRATLTDTDALRRRNTEQRAAALREAADEIPAQVAIASETRRRIGDWLRDRADALGGEDS